MKELKRVSNLWLKERGRDYADFEWQGGYADYRFALSLTRSGADALDLTQHTFCVWATNGHQLRDVARVKTWQKRNRRFHFHFTPTSASWLNMVERFFRDITDKAIRRGVFRTIRDLVAVIEEYVQTHNSDPKPFIWTASANDILEKVKRGRRKLDNI